MSVLCICLSVTRGGGTALVPPWTENNTEPTLDDGDGRGRPDLQRICCSQTTGACYPQTSAEPGHPSNGHNDNYHFSFIVGQPFVQAAQCTIFVTWGQVYPGWCFISRGHPLTFLFHNNHRFRSFLIVAVYTLFCTYYSIFTNTYIDPPTFVCVEFFKLSFDANICISSMSQVAFGKGFMFFLQVKRDFLILLPVEHYPSP